MQLIAQTFWDGNEEDTEKAIRSRPWPACPLPPLFETIVSGGARDGAAATPASSPPDFPAR